MSTHDTPDTPPEESFENKVAKVKAEVQELANALGYLHEALNTLDAIREYGLDSDTFEENERSEILYLKELEKCNDSYIVSCFFPDTLRYLFLAHNDIKEPNGETPPEEVYKIIRAYIEKSIEDIKESIDAFEGEGGYYEGIFEEDGTVIIPEGTQEENERANLFCELFSQKGIFPALAMVKKIPDDLARHDVLARGLYQLLQHSQVNLGGMKPFIQAMRDIKKNQGHNFSETEGEQDAGAELLKKREANVLHVRALAAYAVRLINEIEEKFGELYDREVFIDISNELKKLEYDRVPGQEKKEENHIFKNAFRFLKWKMRRDKVSSDPLWSFFTDLMSFNRGDEANEELFNETFSVEIDYSQPIKHMMDEAGIHYVQKLHAEYETLFHYRMPKEGRFKI